MTRPEIIQLPLPGAYLCADPDCSTIGNDSRQYPRCHSQVLNLAGVLDRMAKPTKAKEESEAAA